MANRDDSGARTDGASDRAEEIERLAALTLAPLVEVAWADGRVTPAEREGVLEAARAFGLRQTSPFCRTTLLRWLHEEPPTEALRAWRELLVPTLEEAESRLARESQRRLLGAARRIAKMDVREFVDGTAIDPQAGITEDEQRVLDELASELARLQPDDVREG